MQTPLTTDVRGYRGVSVSVGASTYLMVVEGSPHWLAASQRGPFVDGPLQLLRDGPNRPRMGVPKVGARLLPEWNNIVGTGVWLDAAFSGADNTVVPRSPLEQEAVPVQRKLCGMHAVVHGHMQRVAF